MPDANEKPEKPLIPEGGMFLVRALMNIGAAHSMSQARRLIGMGAVRVNGVRVSDLSMQLETGKEFDIKVGPDRPVDEAEWPRSAPDVEDEVGFPTETGVMVQRLKEKK